MEFLASPSVSEIEASSIISCPVGLAGLLTRVAYTSSDVKTMGVVPFESVILCFRTIGSISEF